MRSRDQGCGSEATTSLAREDACSEGEGTVPVSRRCKLDDAEAETSGAPGRESSLAGGEGDDEKEEAISVEEALVSEKEAAEPEIERNSTGSEDNVNDTLDEGREDYSSSEQREEISSEEKIVQKSGEEEADVEQAVMPDVLNIREEAAHGDNIESVVRSVLHQIVLVVGDSISKAPQPVAAAASLIPSPEDIEEEEVNRMMARVYSMCCVCLNNESTEYLECQSGHKLCPDCAEIYLRTRIQAVLSPNCPLFSECGDIYTGDQVKKFANPTSYARYLRFKCLRVSPNNRECPGCGEIILGKPEAPDMTCETCKAEFCFQHSWLHRGRKCADFRQRSAFNVWVWNRIHTTKCPGCGRRVQRHGGCAHMTCICGAEFCWWCGKDYTALGDPYRHFQVLDFRTACQGPRFVAGRVGLVLCSPIIAGVLLAVGAVAIGTAPIWLVGAGIAYRHRKKARRAAAAAAAAEEAANVQS